MGRFRGGRPIRKYLFSDESGDLQCRADSKVSKYFAVGTLLMSGAEHTALRTALSVLRDELAWRSHGLDSSFHATTDQQYVRDRVFEVLSHLNFRFDVTLLEKRKAQPQLRPDEPTLFKYAWYFQAPRDYPGCSGSTWPPPHYQRPASPTSRSSPSISNKATRSHQRSSQPSTQPRWRSAAPAH